MAAVRAGQDIENQPGHAVPGSMVVGVAHQGPGDPVTAVCRADVEPPDLCRASAGQGSEADAAGGLSSEIGDQEDSRRAVDALQAAAFTLKYGGKLADASWHWPSGLGLGRCHVLEDQGEGVAFPADRESAQHAGSGHVGSSDDKPTVTAEAQPLTAHDVTLNAAPHLRQN